MAIVEQGQSLFDFALQHCGDASAAFDLALLNSISITDKLTPGTNLIVSEIIDAGIVEYFRVLAVNGFVPGTEINEANDSIQPQGIGYWAIGIDFIVS